VSAIKLISREQRKVMEAQPETDHTVVIWSRDERYEEGEERITGVRLAQVVFSGGYWVEPARESYVNDAFYPVEALPEILDEWKRELENT
jgi:hypothetical protein